jgi:hypothetical protein
MSETPVRTTRRRWRRLAGAALASVLSTYVLAYWGASRSGRQVAQPGDSFVFGSLVGRPVSNPARHHVLTVVFWPLWRIERVLGGPLPVGCRDLASARHARESLAFDTGRGDVVRGGGISFPGRSPCSETQSAGDVPCLADIPFGIRSSDARIRALHATVVTDANELYYQLIPDFTGALCTETLSMRGTCLGRPSTLYLTFVDDRLIALCSVMDSDVCVSNGETCVKLQWLALDAALAEKYGAPTLREVTCRTKTCSRALLARGPEGNVEGDASIGFSSIWRRCPTTVWLHYFGGPVQAVFQSEVVGEWVRRERIPR